MSRALVIGEALIDIVERGGRVIDEHVGGSPLNVAVGLARLGHDVDFLTRIGDDPRGRVIAEYVTASGANLLAGSTGAGRTATARAMLDAVGSATYEFDIDWRLDAVPEATAPGPSSAPGGARDPVVVHTGSIATVLEPGCTAVTELLEQYRASATITFDPNVRPALITDAAQAVARIEHLVERADVVKASDEDLRWLAPNSTPEEVAQRWATMGPALVFVTMGGDGAFAATAGAVVRVAARPVQVADTVGAGDSFMTGLIDALWTRGLLGADRREALAAVSDGELTAVLDTAVLNAALTVARDGAYLPDRATRDAAAHSGTSTRP